jgi:hypothetical protein
LLLK